MARHRRPKADDPGEMYFWTGGLLILVFGICLGVAHDAYIQRDHGWMWIFIAFATGSAGLYFWIVHSWLRWMGLTGDSATFNEYVCCVDGHCEYLDDL